MAVKNKFRRNIIRSLIAVIAMLNVVAIFHSYKFTHFTEGNVLKTADAGKLTAGQKFSALLFGVNNPRPKNDKTPSAEFETIYINSNKKIECWHIKSENPLGTIILFHGFGGSKATMLDKAQVFSQLGYSTLLVDFMGSGGSEGNQTTIGYLEAKQVKSCFEYLQNQGEKNIFLLGTSMGAVAIMKALNDTDISPSGIILECPFGSMCETVCARFRSMHTPTFPMAGLLVFWGGIQNGFWAFGHNPEEYAKQIKCPALLMYGAKDVKVSRAETDRIFAHIPGPKQLKIYPEAGHENYLNKYQNEWTADVREFLNSGKLFPKSSNTHDQPN